MANGVLSAEWEGLSHSPRVRKAVEVGRQSRSDATAARLLRDWSTGGERAATPGDLCLPRQP